MNVNAMKTIVILILILLWGGDSKAQICSGVTIPDSLYSKWSTHHNDTAKSVLVIIPTRNNKSNRVQDESSFSIAEFKIVSEKNDTLKISKGGNLCIKLNPGTYKIVFNWLDVYHFEQTTQLEKGKLTSISLVLEENTGAIINKRTEVIDYSIVDFNKFARNYSNSEFYIKSIKH